MACIVAIDALICCASTSAIAQSQADIERAQREASRLQREEQDRLRRELEQQRKNAAPPAQIEIPTPPPPRGRGEGCVQADVIEIEGAANLSASVRERLIAPYLGRCLGVRDIEQLLGAVTADYLERGFSTTRVYVPSQEGVAKGVLKLMVVEGVVEDIIIDDEGRERISTLTAFPMTVGRPFNLRDFEQGLDQINRLPSNSATMDIQPGQSEGASVIVVKNRPKKPVSLSLSTDNQGSTTTGRTKGNAALTFEGLMGLNDLVSVSSGRSAPYYNGKGPHGKESNTNSVMASLPFGYSLLTASLSKSDYKTTIQGGEPISTEGRTDTTSLVLDHVLARGADYKIGGSMGLTHKDTKTWIMNQISSTSSRRLTVLDVGLNGNTGLLGGVVNGTFGYSRGLHAMGALFDQSDLPDTAPRAQFNKLSYGAGWSRPFDVEGHKASFSTQFSGQHGMHVLYGSEQFSVGGLSSVRGYHDTSLAGDRGWYLRNDLSVTEPFSYEGIEGTVKPYVGYDIGKILWRYGNAGGTITGMAVGVTVSVDRFSLDLMTVRALMRSGQLDREPATTFAKFTTTF